MNGQVISHRVWRPPGPYPAFLTPTELRRALIQHSVSDVAPIEALAILARAFHDQSSSEWGFGDDDEEWLVALQASQSRRDQLATTPAFLLVRLRAEGFEIRPRSRWRTWWKRLVDAWPGLP